MNYENYGLKEALAPNIYVNKIVLDYYKRDSSIFFADTFTPVSSQVIGSGVSFEPPGLQLTIQTSIIIKADNYEDFFSIISNPEFGTSLKINNYLFIRSKAPDGNISQLGSSAYSQNELLADLLVKFEAEQAYSRILDSIIIRSTMIESQSDNFSSIVSSVVGTSQDENLLTKILFYQKQLPDGTIYYQIPYNIVFKLDNVTNPDDLHLFTFANVENFEIDMDFNFGDFTPDVALDTMLELTDVPIGPLNVEQIILNGKIKSTGVVSKISKNQKTFGGQNAPPANLSNLSLTNINDKDVLRENKFNKLANSIWAGGIHKHPISNRYMAGSFHSEILHPFVDLVLVENSKLVDLRPLRDLDGAELSSIKSALSEIKTTKTNFYSDNEKLDVIKKLNVISDPMLSMRKDKNIDGVFGIDYINFIRKHSVFSGLIDNFLGASVTTPVATQLELNKLVAENLKIKITRIDKKVNNSKLIYDSSRVNEEGIFFDRPNFKTIGYNNNNITQKPLGYLNVIDANKNILNNISNDFNAIEFYTFTDLDSDKILNTNYHYKIDIEMIDPMFVFLEKGLKLLNDAINGRKSAVFNGRTIGLKSFLNFVKSTKANNKSLSNVEKNAFFSYVADSQLNNTNTYSNQSLQELLMQQDIGGSFVNVPVGELLPKKRLAVIQNLFSSDFIKVLFPPRVFGYGTVRNLSTTIFTILDLNNLNSLDISYVQQLIKVLSSLEYNLREAINAISNVDVGNQTTGIGLTVSPINSSINKRIISESNISSTKICVKEYGFDYLSFNPEEKPTGTKQFSSKEYYAAVESMYSKYYDLSTLNNKPNVIQRYISEFLPSYMLLEKKGVQLPEAFNSNDESWNQLLQKLLLYKQNNISKLSPNTIFTYTQEENNAAEYKFDINSSLNTSDSQQFKLLKSLSRGKKQLISKGMSLPEKIHETQKLFVAAAQTGEPQEGESDDLQSTKVNLIKNDTTDYFLSYINNAVENGNKNKSLYLNLDTENFASSLNNSLFNNSIESDETTLNGTTLPVLSLVHYNSQQINENTSPDGVQKDTKLTYSQYYPKNIWDLGPGTNTKKLFFDKYGDFFFEFINSVRVEYLSGFDKLDLTTIIETPDIIPGDPGSALSGEFFSLARTVNINLSSYNWLTLDMTTLRKSKGGVIICRLIDFTPAAFAFLDIPLISELKFYDKYYKYFLINENANNDNIDALINFGTTL